MELNEYQEKAMTTCLPSSNNFSYMILNLIGELGEFSSKIGKAIRKNKLTIEENELRFNNDGWYQEALAEHPHEGDEALAVIVERMKKEFMDDLKKEGGDIQWQISGLFSVMGWKLEEDVAQPNLAKLASRKQRGKIDGNGDNR